MLLRIAFKFIREEDKDKTFHFLNKGLKDEYYLTMFLLGDYYKEMQDINTAIEYYQKALDNGYDKAAKKLCDIYYKKEDYNKSDKYHIFEFYTREPQINNNE